MSTEDAKILLCVVRLLNEVEQYGNKPDDSCGQSAGIDPLAWQEKYAQFIRVSIKNLQSLTHPH